MSGRPLLSSTAIAGLLVTPAAFAADQLPVFKAIPALPAMSWAGPYLGLSAGYAWSDPGVGCMFSGASPCATFTYPAPRATGPLGTFQAGYNWQVGTWVLGLESDISTLDVHATRQFPSVDAGKTDAIASRYDWLGTVRGRAGYAAGADLFYATGGYAVGRASHQYVYDISNVAGSEQGFASSQMRSGWAAGLGWEHAIGQHWSLKAEYLHVGLETSDLNISTLRFTGSGGNVSSILRFNNDLNILRVGANFRF